METTRINFHKLEKQADQIDTLMTLYLNKSSLFNSNFLTALFITAFLCIISVIFLI
jgi:hypothetical protein